MRGGGRTHNLRLRRPTLYPIELRALPSEEYADSPDDGKYISLCVSCNFQKETFACGHKATGVCDQKETGILEDWAVQEHDGFGFGIGAYQAFCPAEQLPSETEVEFLRLLPKLVRHRFRIGKSHSPQREGQAVRGFRNLALVEVPPPKTGVPGTSGTAGTPGPNFADLS